MTWAVRAGTNTLATHDNLARWGVRVDSKCLIDSCGAHSNLGHILSYCQKSLDRFRFWHDSVLLHIPQKVIKNIEESRTEDRRIPGAPKQKMEFWSPKFHKVNVCIWEVSSWWLSQQKIGNFCLPLFPQCELYNHIIFLLISSSTYRSRQVIICKKYN